MAHFKDYVVEKKTYLREDLLKLLPNYHFAMIATVDDYDDGDGPQLNINEEKGKQKLYLTNVSDIVKVYVYSGCFSTSRTVYFKDKEPIKLYSDNVTFRDRDGNEEIVERSSKCSFISPCIDFACDFIEQTEKLDEWLLNQGVKQEDLNSIKKSAIIDTYIEYPGVSTPSIEKSWDTTYYSFSSEDLKLKGSEIEEVLDSIDDELLRLKIECILRARVFKRGC